MSPSLGPYRCWRLVLFEYKRYVAFLKWLTLSLFAYVVAFAAVHVPWNEAAKGLLVPKVSLDATFLTTLVAVLGTTISPYLFVWQASQEAEDRRIDGNGGKTSSRCDRAAPDRELRRIRVDTIVGMAFSNLIAISIIITTAATLHAADIRNISSSAQAAAALKPLAGPFAELLFALGIIGTGLLSVPVLAGSTAYALGEARKWPVGLSRKPKQAAAFYAVLVLSGGLGIALNFVSLDPIKALYWSAVINGVLAAPVMVMLMLLAHSCKVMGAPAVQGRLYWVGWVSTTAMALSALGMAISVVWQHALIG